MKSFRVFSETPDITDQMKKLNENNIWERVLTGEELEHILSCLSSPMREMALVTFYLCMRQGEILKLTRDKVDFELNFIRLAGTDTKNGSKRSIPIHPWVREMLINTPRELHTNRVFLRWRTCQAPSKYNFPIIA